MVTLQIQSSPYFISLVKSGQYLFSVVVSHGKLNSLASILGMLNNKNPALEKSFFEDFERIVDMPIYVCVYDYQSREMPTSPQI